MLRNALTALVAHQIGAGEPNFTYTWQFWDVWDFMWTTICIGSVAALAWRLLCRPDGSLRTQAGRCSARVAVVGLLWWSNGTMLLRGAHALHLIKRAMRCVRACSHVSGGPREILTGPTIAFRRPGIAAQCTHKLTHKHSCVANVRHAWSEMEKKKQFKVFPNKDSSLCG